MLRVYYYVPNLIDYTRVVLNLAAFYYMLHKPYLTVALHFTGNLFLDCFDGITARALDQCSEFGDLFDKLLDRCGRIGMLMGLCVLYPQHLFILQSLVCLEVAGSWANHCRRVLRSDPNHNFQHVFRHDPWIVRTYFEEPTLTLVIFGQDMCVYMCYLLYFSPGPTVSIAGSSHSLWEVLAWLGAPVLIYRQVAVCGLMLVTLFQELAQLHHHQDTGRKKA